MKNGLPFGHKLKLTEKSINSRRETFCLELPVPKRFQEIRQIKINGANQLFFTVFWRKTIKMNILMRKNPVLWNCGVKPPGILNKNMR